MQKTLKIFGIIFLLFGVCYFLCELFTILGTTAGYQAYYKNTISDLIVPPQFSDFSPRYYIMMLALIVCGSIYAIGTMFAICPYMNKYKKLVIALSICFATGSIITALISHSSSYSFFHYVGAVLTFVSGNMLSIYISKSFQEKHKKFTKIGIFLGFLGIFSAFLIILTPISYCPICERITIYSVVIFEMIVGVQLLYFDNELKEKTNLEKNMAY